MYLLQVERSDFAEFFAGNKPIPGTQGASHCYCGHQFGLFAGQLGDGAVHYLGEVGRQGGCCVYVVGLCTALEGWAGRAGRKVREGGKNG